MVSSLQLLPQIQLHEMINHLLMVFSMHSAHCPGGQLPHVFITCVEETLNRIFMERILCVARGKNDDPAAELCKV